MPKNINIYFTTLVNISLLISCSEVHSSKGDNNTDPKFATNATLNELDKTVQYISSDYDFCVVFFQRDDSNEGWYKIFARKWDNWEKIEVRERVPDEQQMKSDPRHYILRDITTKKLCNPEEADAFMEKLKKLGLFELREEKVFFKNCNDCGIADLGSVHIEIISGDKVRSLKYSETYKCPGKEWDTIWSIAKIYETEWFENSRGR